MNMNAKYIPPCQIKRHEFAGRGLRRENMNGNYRCGPRSKWRVSPTKFDPCFAAVATGDLPRYSGNSRKDQKLKAFGRN